MSTVLYPPIMPSYQPIQVVGKDNYFYFQLSSFNTLDQVDSIHYRIYDISSNTPLKDGVIEVQKLAISNQYKAAIDNSADDKIKTGTYKLRISLIKGSTESELSQISYMKFMKTEPILKLSLFDTDDSSNDGAEAASTGITIYKDIYNIYGVLDCDNTDYLKDYRIWIQGTGSYDNRLIDSGIVSASVYQKNIIDWTLTKSLINGGSYNMVIKYVTADGYEGQRSVSFTLLAGTGSNLPCTITAAPDTVSSRQQITSSNGLFESAMIVDKDIGRIKVTATSQTAATGDPYSGNVMLRRTSSKTNYELWEDIKIFEVVQWGSAEPQILEWSDYTVENGIGYKYGIQTISSDHSRGTMTTSSEASVLFDDVILNEDDVQINIKYNPQISSYKRNISESKTETLGSKYPFIKRNTAMNYKSFSIGGLITYLMDADYQLFAEQGRIFGAANDDTDEYVREYLFREKLLDFLTNSHAKLFRSATQGNVLVKLMNVQLSPLSSGVKQIYSFTADAIEIDECTLPNLSDYGVCPLGRLLTQEEQKQLTTTVQVLGQVSINADSDRHLKEEVEKSVVAPKGFTYKLKEFNWVRFSFQDTPEYSKKMKGVGHWINVEGNDILVDPVIQQYVLPYQGEDSGYENITIHNGAGTVLVDYYATFYKENENTRVNTGQVSTLQVGQIATTFNAGEDVISMIRNKYQYLSTTQQRVVDSVNKVWIEAAAGTVINVQDDTDASAESHTTGQTGFLGFSFDDATIKSLSFENQTWAIVNYVYDLTVSTYEEKKAETTGGSTDES